MPGTLIIPDSTGKTALMRFTAHFRHIFYSITLLLVASLAACNTVQPTLQNSFKVTLQADGSTQSLDMPAGSTVQMVLEKSGLTLGSLDRLDPAASTALTGPLDIRLVRVREEFENEDTVIAFLRQTMRNETLPQGQSMLIQPGINGLQQTTYRKLFENGVQVSHVAMKTSTITEPRPEILMVGVQAPFTPIPIPGKLAYLSGGNAWVMERTTADRRPVVTTGDLDGQIFSLSPDGKWLLFTRKSKKPAAEEINSLWVINLTYDTAQPVDLAVKNVINFAEWRPGVSNTIYYTTVEPRLAAPGWQANNDLRLVAFTGTGAVLRKEDVIQTNQGGMYGWWGTTYAWSADGKQLLYARPDAVGWVDLEKKNTQPLLDLLPFQARGDWAWIPGFGLSADRKMVYLVTHTPKTGLASQQSSPIFDLTALNVDTKQSIRLGAQTGMFAYPVISPYVSGKRFFIAYLQAAFPEQSETSRYRLTVVDRDGSNRRVLFPPEGQTGLEPQRLLWSPAVMVSEMPLIACIYQGNLTFVHPETGQTQPVTGDGLVVKIDWK